MEEFQYLRLGNSEFSFVGNTTSGRVQAQYGIKLAHTASSVWRFQTAHCLIPPQFVNQWVAPCFFRETHAFVHISGTSKELFVWTSTLHTYRDASRYCTQQVNDNSRIPDSRPPRHCFDNDPNSFKCAMPAGKKRLTSFVVTNTCYQVYDNLMTISQTCWYGDASKSQLSAENQVLSLPCFVKKHYGVSLGEVEKTPLVLGKFCREFLKSLFLLASCIYTDGLIFSRISY